RQYSLVKRLYIFTYMFLLQLGRKVLSLTFLKLTTSTSDGKTPFGGEIVSHRKVLTASHSI
ncbi:hypothetical protein, partial [Limosilactobacillus sp.]|uniref:hypothetical protein n=1 Tax=Limosilactobacillus sp. TaxID=2773925 RepID=UPI0025BDD362